MRGSKKIFIKDSKKIALFFVIFLFGFLLVMPNWSRSKAISSTNNSYSAQPLPSVAQPPKGSIYSDPVYGTSILRLTDSSDATTANVAYSYWPVFNSNSTRIIIGLDYTPTLYSFNPTTFTFQKQGPLFSNCGCVPMEWEGMTWSTTDPDTVYGISGYNSNTLLRAYNVATKQFTFVHDFTASGELPLGTPSQMSKARSNDRYFSFHWKPGTSNTAKYAVVYDKQLNKTYLFDVQDPTYAISSYDECRLDRDGNYLVISTGKEFHVWQFATQTPAQQTIVQYNSTQRGGGHGDFGSGVHIHSDIWGNNGNRIIKRSLAAPQTWQQVFDSGVTDWITDQHLSLLGPDDTWGLISTETRPADYTKPFCNELFLTKTDGSGQVIRLLQHRSSNNSYYVSPLANLSPDGRFAAYNSDFGGGHCDVYIAILPTGLWNNTPPPPPVSAPTAQASATPTTGTAPLAVAFSASGSTTPNGSITSYNWSFGDGTSGTGISVSHTYTVAGTYNAILTITDSANQTATKNLTITASAALLQLPTAQASATPTTGAAPLAVAFSASGSTTPNGSITSYSWSFGDGTSGTGISVSHTYTVAGSYNAILTIKDSANQTATKNLTITANAASPVARIVATPTSGAAPLNVVFDGSTSSSPNGAIASYNWNFGDNSSATGKTTTHTYTVAGNYTATLTVTDSLNKTALSSVIITVTSSSTTVSKAITFVNGNGNAASQTYDTSILSISYPNYTIDTTYDGRLGGPFGATTLIALPQIFGAGVNQIPLGAKITSATLTLSIYSSQATGITASRILDPNNRGMWYTGASPSNDNVGVSFNFRDGRSTVRNTWSNTTGSNLFQVLAPIDSTTMLTGAEAAGSKVTLNVTASVAAWAAGAVNQGWAIRTTSTTPNAIYVYDSLSYTDKRPVLTVQYTVSQ